MKIQAKIKLKHGMIANAIENSDESIKSIAKKSGWHYNALVSFINIKGYPECYNNNECDKFERLYVEIAKLDPSITFDDIKPCDYSKAVDKCELLSGKSITKDIDFDHIIEYEYMNEIDYKTNTIDREIDHKDRSSISNIMMKRVEKELSNRTSLILKQRYGFFDDKDTDLESIAKEHRITRERVRQILYSGERFLKRAYRSNRVDVTKYVNLS